MKTLFVVDLDGTLLKGNSLHFFIMTLIRASLNHISLFSMYSLVLILSVALLRKLRLYTHENMKQKLQYLWIEFEKRGCKNFLKDKVKDYLKVGIREKLLRFIVENKDSKTKVVIATAAPEEYVSIMAELLPVIDGVIATPRLNGDTWVHNIREQKWLNIQELIKGQEVSVVSFTDHIDDLALIENSDIAYLFPPIAQDIDSLKKKVNTDLRLFYE